MSVTFKGKFSSRRFTLKHFARSPLPLARARASSILRDALPIDSATRCDRTHGGCPIACTAL